MGWGAMMGLGQGLQQVSGMMLDNYKTKMKEQLEIEKENRAVARQEARDTLEETRKLAEPKTWQVNRLEDGSLVRQGLNYRGDPIKDAVQPMSNVETEDFNRKRELEELDAKHKSLEVTLKGNQVADYATDKELKRRQTEASIASSNRANRGSTSGGGGGAAGAGDVRSSALDATTVNSLFAARDAEGKVIRDEKGNVTIDDDALNAYLTSPDYQAAKDKTAGAARWVERQRGHARQGMRSEGLPEYIIDDRIRGNTTSEVVKPEGLQGATAKLYETTKARLAAAEQEIEAGNITPDQAAAKFEREGFPQVARQIRAKYGR